jgi:hypothetical protein
MKNEKLFLIGGAALAAYFVLPQIKKGIDDTLAKLNPLSGITGGLQNAGQQLDINLRLAQASAEQGIVAAGGTVNQVVNPGGYSNFDAGAASVLANVDFINQLKGANIVNATIAPTSSGSGLLQLRGASGVNPIVANAAIDVAVMAATSPTYGVELVSGGTNVFNITSQGTAATTAFSSQQAIASAIARGLR